MRPLDYSKTYLLGTNPENEVRFWVESRTRVIDERSGKTEDFLQCASCKSEDTFAKRNLFLEDNYDFLPIFGPEYGLIFRRKAWRNPNYKSCLKTSEMFGGPTRHLQEHARYKNLNTAEDIIRFTHEFYPVVAQTEIRHDDSELRAIIEYPVKTLNIRKSDVAYQIDTGPVSFPNLFVRHERLVDSINLAFVAFNSAHFADFIVEESTPIGNKRETTDTHVYHFSRRISLAASNRLYAGL
ncbi:MAG: hypothetical protein OXN17_08815 [Candidatus Poribacteria bacterium]|nr:hypothetical protein [Candidatus Poribacteria bacterium]